MKHCLNYPGVTHMESEALPSWQTQRKLCRQPHSSRCFSDAGGSHPHTQPRPLPAMDTHRQLSPIDLAIPVYKPQWKGKKGNTIDIFK